MADIGHIKMKHFDHIARHLEINELDLKTETKLKLRAHGYYFDLTQLSYHEQNFPHIE